MRGDQIWSDRFEIIFVEILQHYLLTIVCVFFSHSNHRMNPSLFMSVRFSSTTLIHLKFTLKENKKEFTLWQIVMPENDVENII